MSGLQNAGTSICYACVAVSILSVLLPQKRTRRILSFVLGVFFIGVIVTGLTAQFAKIDISVPEAQDIAIPTYSEEDYTDTVARMTADNVVTALNELLINEGITPDDIDLTLKISDEGRISVVRAVIYISESYRDRKTDIESIVYRNLSKEPEIYVTGEDAQRIAE